MTMIIDLTTPEKFKQFEEAYAKALTEHMQDQTKPFDLKAIAEKAGVVDPTHTKKEE